MLGFVVVVVDTHIHKGTWSVYVQPVRRLETAAHPRSGGAWVGHHVATVDIDHWGRFKFVLLRLHEPSGTRHKLLVRGKVRDTLLDVCLPKRHIMMPHVQNYANEAKLVAAVQQEADSVRVQHVLPHVKVQHVGTGVMEWSKDRDRRLHIVQGTLLIFAWGSNHHVCMRRVGGGRAWLAWHDGCGAAGGWRGSCPSAAQLLDHDGWPQWSILNVPIQRAGCCWRGFGASILCWLLCWPPHCVAVFVLLQLERTAQQQSCYIKSL